MESPHDTNRLWYITSDLIYMVLKSKIFIVSNAKEFDCWNFRLLTRHHIMYFHIGQAVTSCIEANRFYCWAGETRWFVAEIYTKHMAVMWCCLVNGSGLLQVIWSYLLWRDCHQLAGVKCVFKIWEKDIFCVHAFYRSPKDDGSCLIVFETPWAKFRPLTASLCLSLLKDTNAHHTEWSGSVSPTDGTTDWNFSETLPWTYFWEWAVGSWWCSSCW